jgi:hypothetical protein
MTDDIGGRITIAEEVRMLDLQDGDGILVLGDGDLKDGLIFLFVGQVFEVVDSSFVDKAPPRIDTPIVASHEISVIKRAKTFDVKFTDFDGDDFGEIFNCLFREEIDILIHDTGKDVRWKLRDEIIGRVDLEIGFFLGGEGMDGD